MASTPVEPTAAEIEAKRRVAERLFEKDGCGLLIVRQDGTVQLVGPGGELFPASPADLP